MHERELRWKNRYANSLERDFVAGLSVHPGSVDYDFVRSLLRPVGRSGYFLVQFFAFPLGMVFTKLRSAIQQMEHFIFDALLFSYNGEPLSFCGSVKTRKIIRFYGCSDSARNPVGRDNNPG